MSQQLYSTIPSKTTFFTKMSDSFKSVVQINILIVIFLIYHKTIFYHCYKTRSPLSFQSGYKQNTK